MTRYLRALLWSAGWGFGQFAHGVLDFTGEGVSELWKASHPGVVHNGSDLDGDGFSNYDELVAGTNPEDDTDYLRLDFVIEPDGEVPCLRWESRGGKVYLIEKFNSGNGEWEGVLHLFPEAISRVREVELPVVYRSGLFRLKVSDIDVDGDGLLAWEESQLGSSDLDSFSVSRTSGRLRTDYLSAIAAFEKPGGVVLANGTEIAQMLPSRAEAARFLMKASFGPTDDLIDEVAEMGCAAWIEKQLEMPATTTAAVLSANGFAGLSDAWMYSWWRLVITAPDQLRQRMAYALSQILVVNFVDGAEVRAHPSLQAHYYDFFVNHVDRSYRELLEEVTYSPVMGWYLSHVRNRKANPALNRYPDENFAREVMQLFSVGLWELGRDGSQLLDPEGAPIPTYDNETITEMARVFTGMSYSTTNRGKDPTTWFFNAGLPPEDWQNRMRFFPEEHDQDAKTIISGIELPAGQGGELDVKMTLDALCAHQSCAPYLCRLLIQRFTSSNPGPEYIERVVTVWEETGGALDRVLEAILMDPEVLFPEASGHQGKLREPLMRLTHLSRAFRFRPPDPESWAFEYHVTRGVFGQYGMMSPSVFNFYSPDFSPQGELREAGMASPESELTTFTHLINSNNYVLNAVERGYNSIAGDFSVLEGFEPEASSMVDYLDLLMTGGTLSLANRERIIEAVETFDGSARRIEVAIHLLSQCPEFVTIR